MSTTRKAHLSFAVILGFIFVAVGAVQAHAAYVEKTRPAVVFTVIAKGNFVATINASDASGITKMAINLHKETGEFLKACGSVRALPNPASKVYTCTIDTTKLDDGLYELRAGAFDGVGNNKTISEWLMVANNTVPQ